jgi:hypothetical protein
MSNSELQKNILTTITYYDVMGYPLTAFEIWKYLTRISNSEFRIPNDAGDEKVSLVEVMLELENEKLGRLVDEYQGFYFLKGRVELVGQRLERNKIANQKMKKLLQVAGFLRFIPFVRMVAVTGSLAMKNSDQESDLDLLIALKYGRIFTGRLLVTVLVHILGRRRHGKKIADRVCLNYFVTDQTMEVSLKDVFSASEYSFIFPIFGWHDFQKFQKDNQWIRGYKPNFRLDEVYNSRFLYDTFFVRIIREMGEALLNFDVSERYLRQKQMKKIEHNPKTHQPQSLIIANDEMLVFLPEPQGPAIFEKFKERLEKIRR